MRGMGRPKSDQIKKIIKGNQAGVVVILYCHVLQVVNRKNVPYDIVVTTVVCINKITETSFLCCGVVGTCGK